VDATDQLLSGRISSHLSSSKFCRLRIFSCSAIIQVDALTSIGGTQLRLDGNGVDIREQAVAVAERMGLIKRIRATATDMVGMRFVDENDQEKARIDMLALQKKSGAQDVEISRGKLVEILHEAIRDDVRFFFGDTIVAIAQDPYGVDVTFVRNLPERFDPVIGADGLHSLVRRLVFGPDSNFVHFKHHYFAVTSVDSEGGPNRWVSSYKAPGKGVAIYRPGNESAKAFFSFYREQPLDCGHHDIERQQAFVKATFAGMGWYVPELLADLEATSDFYFDALSQVKMPSWHDGRVVLVGDAAYSASPASGAGAMLAMVGGYQLAGELKKFLRIPTWRSHAISLLSAILSDSNRPIYSRG
jgi:2-polyprenyl-6-methoxyphenol hydroxylase-like FAD-dependent oxidoreductase